MPRPPRTPNEELDRRLERLAGSVLARHRQAADAPAHLVARLQDRTRAIVAARLRDALKGVPCFCSPDRPELERPAWCVRHVILDRLGGPDSVDTLAAEVLALELEDPT